MQLLKNGQGAQGTTLPYLAIGRTLFLYIKYTIFVDKLGATNLRMCLAEWIEDLWRVRMMDLWGRFLINSINWLHLCCMRGAFC